MGKNSRSPVILFVISGAEFCLVIRAFKLRSHEHAKNGSVFLHPSDFFGQCYGKNWTERWENSYLSVQFFQCYKKSDGCKQIGRMQKTDPFLVCSCERSFTDTFFRCRPTATHG
jgi:hypothetical protein